MADAKGKAKEALGWLTADRDLEAEGQAEQQADAAPTEAEISEETAEVRKEYGETPDGSDDPDALH